MQTCLPRLAWIGLALASIIPLAAAPKIGVVLQGPKASSVWNSFANGATEAGAKANAEIIVKAPPIDFSAAYQLKLLAALTDQSLDALVIAPPATANEPFDLELAKAIEAFAKKGTKVVVAGMGPLPGFANTTVIIDQDQLAQIGAQRLAEIVTADDEVGILRTYTPDGFTPREKLAMKDVRARFPKIKIYADISIPAGDRSGVEQAKRLLTQYPKISVAYTTMTVSSLAMIQALKDMKLAGKVKHVGYGMELDATTAAALESGDMTMLFSQDFHSYGVKAVETALALIKGEQLPPVIKVDFTVITKDNIAAEKAKMNARK